MITKLISLCLSKRLKRKTLGTQKEFIGETRYEYAISQSRNEVFLGLARTRPGFFFPSSDWQYFSFGSLHECLEASKALCEAMIKLAEADDENTRLQGSTICPSFNKHEFRINRSKQTVTRHFQGYDRGGENYPLQFFRQLLIEMEHPV
ncbi:MAG: hypothetical protein K9N47_04140 [Prosthecobacter sp.]|uniref:hypothetical protein n=1 Tax=Prosthecobacter sp. TaxID=1965333 RepID=UPI0025F80DC1|nr:hypothetical protein [Prosthecobacter sp.]MCF7785285.1 hypothetical protein [Prosthecobacter sp.]